jgi:signal transduction histidine kinase
MSLTKRFMVLLLGTLGLTLVGFSTALVVSSRVYLDRRVDDRLAATLALLGTCVDPAPGWVRWEPREKRLPPSRWNDRPGSTWMVFDGGGRLLTRPNNVSEGQLTAAWVPRVGSALPGRLTDRGGRIWRVSQRRVRPTAAAVPASGRPADTPDGKSYHDEVVLTAFASLDESEAALGTLAWFLVGVSAVTWALAALFARWLSRRTLAPLIRLAESARGLGASSPGWSLPEVGTREELDDLRGAFNDLLARLHAAYERQRRFSSEASHQLRTPVAVMAGHLEVAQRGERTAEEYRRVVELAHRRAVDLGRIVESLLFLSRDGQGTLARFEPVELVSWLSEHMASRSVGPRSGDLLVQPDNDSTLWVRAHPYLLAQLVENLLENACKYSRPGTPVAVTAGRDGGAAVIAVRDAGCGIAPADLPRIFEPFFRAPKDSFGRVPGAGLGLSVVKRIVQAFGGTVVAHSELGRGSCFEVLLPLYDTPEVGDAGPATVTTRADVDVPALSGDESRVQPSGRVP